MTDLNWLWSWVLSAVGLIGFFLAGSKIWWAWYVNIANQVLWTFYAFYTKQWGFLAGTAFYLYVFIRNAIKWTKEHRDNQIAKEFEPDGYTHFVAYGTYISPCGEKDVIGSVKDFTDRHKLVTCPKCIKALEKNGIDMSSSRK